MELHIGELRHPVDGEKYDQPAFGMTKLAGIDVDVSDLGLGEASPLRRLLTIVGQPGDAVALEASMQGAPGQCREGFPQASQHIVQRWQRPAAELDAHDLFGRCEHAAARHARPHRRVLGRAALAPLGDRLRIQPILLSKGPGTFFRRLDLGSNTRRRAGAAVK